MRTEGNSTNGPRPGRRESGMSLIEVVVAVTLLAFVAASFYRTYQESQRHMVTGQAIMDMQQNTRVALETIAAEVRSARTIEVMDSDRIAITSDVFVPGQDRVIKLDQGDADGDGRTDEVVLTRSPADDGNPTVETEEVASSIQHVGFRYLSSLDGSVEAQSPEQVRRVEITITGQLNNEYGNATEISFQRVVRPRNLRMPEPPDPDSNAPAPPSNVALKPGCGILEVTWDLNSEDDLSGYRVYYDTGMGGAPYNGTDAEQGSSPIYVGDQASFRLTGLDPGETYYVTVTAVDLSGNESAYSAERMAVPAEGDAPRAPTGVAAEVGGEHSLVVAWDENSEPDVTTYYVYYDSDQSGPSYAWSDSTGVPTIRLDGLSTEVIYYIAVTARDACGNESPYSQEIMGVPRPCSEDATPPATPQGLAGIAGDERAILDWLPNGEPDLHTYRLIYAWNSGVDSLDVGVATHYELGGLTNDVEYVFVLVALDGCDNRSAQSSPVVVRPMSCAGDETPPSTLGCIAVEDGKSEFGDELVISWPANTEADLAGYWLYYGSAPQSYGDPIDVGNVVSYVLDGLIPYETYYISIVAYDRCGNASNYSPEESERPTYACTCFPEVSFANLPDGSVVSNIVPLTANVEPCSSRVVLRVEFLIDGFPERTWYMGPYTHDWDTRRYADGYYELILTSVDNEGCTDGDTIAVIVNNSGLGPGCVRVDITVPAGLSGIFDQEVEFGIMNTSAIRSVELTGLTTSWTSQNPEMSVARLHRIEIPIGSEVWSATGLEDAATSGQAVDLDWPPVLYGSGEETARLSFCHEDGDLNPGGPGNMPMAGVLIRTQAEVDGYRACPADSFNAGCVITLTNLEASTGRAYEVAYLDIGDEYYTDKHYIITDTPDGFDDLLWIKTANADRFEGGDYTLEFDVNQHVIVYIAYDPRDSAPAWITSYYTPVGQSIGVSDNHVDELVLWAREYPQGHVTLSGNRAPGSGQGVRTNYVVLLNCR